MRTLHKRGKLTRVHARIFLAITAACLIVALGLVSYSLMTGHGPQSSPKTPDQTSSVGPAHNGLDVHASDPDPAAVQTGVGDKVTTNQTPASAAFPTTQPNLKVVINAIHQDGHNLIISTAIEPSAAGTCDYELTRDNMPSRVKSMSFTGSSCQDSVLDISGTASGTWALTVRVRVADNVATTTREVAIR